MEKTTIKTIEVVRRIRDAHYEQLKNKTRAERIAFYRDRSQSLYEKAQKLLENDHDTIHAETSPQDKR